MLFNKCDQLIKSDCMCSCKNRADLPTYHRDKGLALCEHITASDSWTKQNKQQQQVVEKIISFTSGALFEKFTYCDSFLYNANTENQLFIKPYSDWEMIFSSSQSLNLTPSSFNVD